MADGMICAMQGFFNIADHGVDPFEMTTVFDSFLATGYEILMITSSTFDTGKTAKTI